jgi:hypothetical protein
MVAVPMVWPVVAWMMRTSRSAMSMMIGVPWSARPILGCRGDAPVGGEDAMNRWTRHRHLVVGGEMPHDRVGPPIQSGGGQPVAFRHNELHGRVRCLARRGVRSPRAWFERLVALGAVAGDEVIDPRAGDAVGGGDLGGATTLDNNSSDHETGFGHPPTSRRGPAHSGCCPPSPETSVRDVLNEDTSNPTIAISAWGYVSADGFRLCNLIETRPSSVGVGSNERDREIGGTALIVPRTGFVAACKHHAPWRRRQLTRAALAGILVAIHVSEACIFAWGCLSSVSHTQDDVG